VQSLTLRILLALGALAGQPRWSRSGPGDPCLWMVWGDDEMWRGDIDAVIGLANQRRHDLLREAATERLGRRAGRPREGRSHRVLILAATLALLVAAAPAVFAQDEPPAEPIEAELGAARDPETALGMLSPDMLAAESRA